MDYLPQSERPESVLNASGSGYVARYALGRDYHKVMRARLRALAERLQNASASAGWRVFVDSAPVMEVELARKAGVGWRGKHTLLIDRSGGSFFFLGEIFTDLPLPLDSPVTEHCGRCTRCIDACPTGAITGPFQLDARRCISYLTIELKGPIPQELRPMIGNRIYGCDDCQIVCPWNKFARLSVEADFSVRHGLDAPDLVELFAWDADSFRSRLAGSAIYRIGHERWLRNIAVALGNATTNQRVIHALRSRSSDPSPLVREHVAWALARHEHNRDFS
jgi:epoxyqueuosine reductase